MPDSDSLIVGGRPLDVLYGPFNSSVPQAVRPAPEKRFLSFRLDTSPNDPRRPVILGAGALFGPVVRGHLDDNEPVAVKSFVSLKPEYNRQYLETHATHEYRRGAADLGPRFVRARALIETLDHEAMPAFLLVMDLVQGHTLETLIGTPIPAQQQRMWLTDALEALRIMSEHNLIQQDIKPANIMSTDRGLVFIDHGSSRAPSEATHTNDQRTLAYLAPEYEATGTFTDETMIFGIGLTLLEIFTGGRPYLEPAFNRQTATDNDEYLRRTWKGTLNLNDAALDRDVAHIIAVMMSPEPSRRLDVLLEDWDSVVATTRTNWQQSLHEEPSRVAGGNSFTPSVQDIADQEFELVSRANVPGAAPKDRGGDDPQVQMLPLSLPEDDLAPRNSLIDFAGVDSTAVHADNERRHYSFIGVALVVYLLYVIGGVLALVHQVTNDWVIALVAAALAGPVLGVAMVNLDRSIVNSIRPNLNNLSDPTGDEPPLAKGGWKYNLNIAIRVVATILIAFLVGSAVDVELHRRDVLPVVAEEQQALRTTLNQEVKDTFGARQKAATARVNAAKKELNDARELGGKLRKAAEKESEGKGATRKASCGRRCNQLLDDAARADEKYRAQSDRLQKAVDRADGASEELENEIDTFKAPKLQQIEEATGPIAQGKALWKLSLRDPYTMATNLGLIAVFMVIELFAVFMKLTTSGNSYERSQGRRARRQELVELQDDATQRAKIIAVSEANRQLQEDLINVQFAARTLDLEDIAKALYAGRLPDVHGQPTAPRTGSQPPNGGQRAYAPTLVMLTQSGP